MLTIAKEFTDEMVAHSLEENPNECCGILSGRDENVEKLYRITNTTKSPYRYLMDPQEFLNADIDTERNGWDFIAFYHSHTHSPAVPSITDVRMAQQSGYHEVYYVLVSLESKEEPQIRAFHINQDGAVVEEEYQIA